MSSFVNAMLFERRQKEFWMEYSVWWRQETCQNFSIDLRCETIDHVRVFNNDEIQPPAASLPACGHPHFMTPGLQQLSYCLKYKGKGHMASNNKANNKPISPESGTQKHHMG